MRSRRYGPGRATRPRANQPAISFLQGRRSRLARQQLLREPAAERGLGRVVEADDREVAEGRAAMPAAGATCPIVAVERLRPDADLRGQMPDHRRGEIGPVIGKPALLAPIGELRGQTKLARVGQVGQQRQVFRQERPVLAKLARRPQPLHRPTPSSPEPEATGWEPTSPSEMAKVHSFAVTGPIKGTRFRPEPALANTG
jgi:hypothetical protein